MGSMSRFHAAAAVLLATLSHAPAHAQTTPAAQAAPSDGRFLAMDVFGGAHPQPSTASGASAPAATFGWEIGSSVRFTRWAGVAAAVGRVRTPERHWITHVQVGPRLSHTLGSVSDLRGFAHVLVGRAASELRTGATQGSLELMAGGGVDVFNVFRFQLDLVRRDLDAFPKTGGRFLFGVAMPLCFSGCTEADGFRVR